MPTPTKGPRLGGSPAHQKLILSNLATALFEHGRITTTEAKARRLRPLAEKLITKAKKAELGTVESLHNRREVLKVVRDKSVVHVLFTKIGPRKGDNAPMAVIELVTEEYKPKAPRTKAKTESAPAPAEETPEAPAADEVAELEAVDGAEVEAIAAEDAEAAAEVVEAPAEEQSDKA